MGWVCLTHLFVLAIAPGLTDRCCHEKQRHGISEKPPPRSHYRVVLGDPFVMACVGPGSTLSSGGVVWSRSGPGPDLLEIPALTAEHSRNYSCRTGTASGEGLQLQVLEASRLGCSSERAPTLILGMEGEIYCPPSSCGDPDLSDTQVTWYQRGRAISELQQRRRICGEGPRLVLCEVFMVDSGVYSCDRHARGPGPLWTTRRALNVTVIPPDTNNSPMILVSNCNRTEEVVIGEPHTLLCEVKFGFERNFTPVVQWYSSTAADQAQKVLIGQVQTRETLSFHETKVTQVAVLQVVTELHLQHVFTCLATNAVGTTNCTTRLRRRNTAGHWLVGAAGPIVCVVLLTGLVLILYLHNLELKLIYRSYWQSSNHAGEDGKDIDVFLSHAWSHASEDGTGTHTSLLPSPFGEQGSPLSREPLAYTPLEVLLRLDLEGSGYRLFLMERDLLPGGVYTEDVVRVIQRSRCLVCLLSGDFLSNSSAVFVLEAGVQALLRDPELKVMVIWTEPRPASMGQLDPPLPRLVHRALRVLPRLDWLPGLSLDSSRMFWKSFWKTMPKQSGASLTQSHPV